MHSRSGKPGQHAAVGRPQCTAAGSSCCCRAAAAATPARHAAAAAVRLLPTAATAWLSAASAAARRLRHAAAAHGRSGRSTTAAPRCAAGPWLRRACELAVAMIFRPLGRISQLCFGICIKPPMDDDVITVQCPEQCVGAVVGRGGEVIKEICRISGANVKVRKAWQKLS